MLGKTLGVLIARGGSSGGSAPVPAMPGQAVSAGCVGMLDIPLWCVGLESGALWGSAGAGDGLSEVGAVSSPGLCLLSSFPSPSPLGKADTAGRVC